MSDVTQLPNPGSATETLVLAPGATGPKRPAETRVAEISALLAALEEAAAESGLQIGEVETVEPPSTHPYENRLVQARLGLASSLYLALGRKHPQTASHSLRVALGCSSWALYEELADEVRDVVEVSALLHDIGKIGAPDKVLIKPGRLTDAERALVAQCRQTGWEIVAGCCHDERVLAAVRCAGYRFDGAGNDEPLSGESIPLAARMIAIVDAFDSMTTDQVYRRARSREQALADLMEEGGKQFDPVLVRRFADVMSHRQDLLTERVAARWLGDLSSGKPTLPWGSSDDGSLNSADQEARAPEVLPHAASSTNRSSLFEAQLIDSLHDGVLFVDAQSVIFMWSKGAELLTGVAAGAATGRLFAPSLLDMCDSDGRRVPDAACPVQRALTTSAQLRQRMQVLGRQGVHVAVDLHVIPVLGLDGLELGATVVLHDAQPQASLEEKCEALHDEATRDPLTRVANRAEFDRMQTHFIEAHLQARRPCSLMMVDIDHFKRINDTHGHQAGDEALIVFAGMLKSMCRNGDLVARYGGEEFAVLCADCTNADATRRAEQMRRKLNETTHANLGNKRITASFGVTELQAGDSPETMLRRADRALLQAKAQGRNQVVQLGNAMDENKPKKNWWARKLSISRPIVDTRLVTAVPIDIAIEKLRGFVSDQEAKIVKTKDNRVEMEISSENIGAHRRRKDKPETFRIVIEFSEERIEKTNSLGFASGEYVRTAADVKVAPKKPSSRRSADHGDRARLILQSLKAYLMAKEPAEDAASLFKPTLETV